MNSTPDPTDAAAAAATPYADVPAFDVIDGELLPRVPGQTGESLIPPTAAGAFDDVVPSSAEERPAAL